MLRKLYLDKDGRQLPEDIFITYDAVKIDLNQWYRIYEVDQFFNLTEGRLLIANPQSSKYFNSEKLAKQYILYNKPFITLSILLKWANESMPGKDNYIVINDINTIKNLINQS